MSVTINIAGDFCVTPSFVEKNLLSEDIIQLFKTSDINVVNLECPVNNNGDEHKIIKHGPHLFTTEQIFKHLKALNISAVTLANNHILDYGVQGLQSTLLACKKNSIAYVGVGKNLKGAANYTIIENQGYRIALVNFCENEWSVATEETAGANPLDIIENLNQIKKARSEADFVLVIVHGGNEYYNLPSPRMVKQYRFFAENGADAVISHHTHCISGFEIHNNKVPIFYGLGNMLFTKQSDQAGWFTGLTAQLILEKGQPIQFNLLPTSQSKDDYKLSLLKGDDKQQVLREIEMCSSILATEEKLLAAWAALIKERSPQYLYHFSAAPFIPGKYLKSAFRRLGLVDKLLPKKYLVAVINYICCEAHLDIATEVLKNKLSKK
jgi:poly-gamma-glutamate synthesis protein (capsule biosynthesis protein)